MSCRTHCDDHQTGHSFAARQYQTLFWIILYIFSLRGGGGGRGKVVEIDSRCFSRQKCNCGRLCVTAWVFVDAAQELGTPVADHSTETLLFIIKACTYPAPQSSVTAVGTTFISSIKDSHTMPSIAPSFFVAHWCSHKYSRGHMEAHQHSPQALLRKWS
jgi:hypothetical protein